jgi:hypothetical protein
MQLSHVGAWFVNERWIATDPYENVQGLPPNAFSGASDASIRPFCRSTRAYSLNFQHDIARSPNAKQALEKQWDTWIGDEDWKWIVEHGFNAVRLPVCPKLKKLLSTKADLDAYHLNRLDTIIWCLEFTMSSRAQILRLSPMSLRELGIESRRRSTKQANTVSVS